MPATKQGLSNGHQQERNGISNEHLKPHPPGNFST